MYVTCDFMNVCAFGSCSCSAFQGFRPVFFFPSRETCWTWHQALGLEMFVLILIMTHNPFLNNLGGSSDTACYLFRPTAPFAISSLSELLRVLVCNLHLSFSHIWQARCDRVPLADYGDMPHIFRMEERGDTLYVTRPRACAST